MRRGTIFAAFAACLFLTTSGCSEIGWGGDDDDDISIGMPTWVEGQYWDYAFHSDDVDIDSARMVMAGIEGENYVVGTSRIDDARRHAVLNINPLLGRARFADLAVYENGEPELFLSFPLEEGKTWSFAFLGVEQWDARVEKIREEQSLGKDARVAYIHAEGSDGTTLDYQYDSAAGWIRFLEKADGTDVLLRMVLIEHGTGWTGNAYFVRGRDLMDETYESSAGNPVADVFDTYVDSGHPKYGDFSYLVYFSNYDAGGDGEIYWILRDHTGGIGAQDFYNNEEGVILGTTASVEGNWTLALEMTGNCYFRLRVAGGIEYSWSV
ncbi:MAG: hypothetical protein L0Z54_02425 [Thermoplasmata archaeon]|nr:hypothetical protein [Thermoplasmata archaeon]